MNNEFQWRNELRKLGGPAEPARDLWPAIALRIDAAAPVARPRRRHAMSWAIAATLIVAIGAGVLMTHGQRGDATRVVPAIAQAPQRIEATAPVPAATTQTPRTALDWDVPDDPTLAATAQKLDTASAQLQDALEQRPDAVFLVGIMNRTNAMRMRLMRKSPYPG